MRSCEELYHSMRTTFESATDVIPLCWQMSTRNWNLWKEASPEKDPFGLPVTVMDANGDDHWILYYANRHHALP